MNISISNKNPTFGKAGDLISEKRVADSIFIIPWIIITLSIPMILDIQSNIFFILSVSLAVSYLILLFKFQDKQDIPMIGQISEAIANPKKETLYFSKFATVVKDFKGTTPEQGREGNLKKDNILYDYVVDKSLYTMGILLAGATGSGKTVSLTSTVIHPVIVSGSGMIFVEGKGDRPISEGIYSMAAEHGREEDLFVLDFAAAISGGFSHAVAPLEKGSATNLVETLTNIINVMTGENAWVTEKATKYMMSILLLLVPLRDLKLMPDPEDIKEVRTLKQLQELKKHDLNIALLQKYLNFQSALYCIYMFRALLEDLEFVKLLQAHPKHKLITDYELSYVFPMQNLLSLAGLDLTDKLIVPNYNEVVSPDQQKQNNYHIDPWTDALQTFGNEAIYGSIFNKAYADINFLEAMQSGKIIIISLPSMQNSRDKNEKIGKMITALIKSALGEMLSEGEMEGGVAQKEAQKRLRPYKLPFMLIFDEISNYGSDMIGQISSMCRSIGFKNGGIGLMTSGQSETDLKRIGENGIDGDQIKANLGINYFLNLSDNGYAEMAQTLCGKKWEYDFNRQIKLTNGTQDSDDSASLDAKEVDWYTKDYFMQKLKKQTGEGIVIQSGFPEPVKIVAHSIAPNPLLNKGFSATNEKDITLVKNISHEKLLSYFQKVA